jgi:enamine deaminase RidA (YjgF/YER057c/UK114 family)
MTVAYLKSDRLVPPAGLYSHAAIGSGHSRLVAIAGQVAVDGSGNSVGVGDFACQFSQVFQNLGDVLRASSCSWSDVLTFTTYLTREENLVRFYEERHGLFPSLYPGGNAPPNTLLVISSLVKSEFLIEISALAAAEG